MTDRNRVTLHTGGHKGTEAEFGRCAERWGIAEVTLSFAGHQPERDRNLRVLSAEELIKGDVSMEIVAKRMGRTYHSGEKIRRVFQLIYHMVNSSYHVFAVGWIQGDDTVQGGTGWGVELAKFFNRPVTVFDQSRKIWATWQGNHWAPDVATIPDRPFAATGTRHLTDEGREAIRDLFERSFGPEPKA
jgi:hypothetical protein